LSQHIIAIACVIVSYMSPDLVKFSGTMNGIKQYIYSYTALLLIGISISVMLYIENRLYIRQNEIAKKQAQEIEGLVASQNRFFSSMSHEIRTPINTIIGLNEMILRENISDEITEDAVNIRAAGRMLLNTINDILDMSKFSSGDMHLVIDNYKTGDMLSDIVGMLWLRAKEKNLEFKINVAPDIPTELKGDEMRIKQVLMNILNNAIKYTKEGSVSLSVECDKKEDGNISMIYTVEDTGMGIKKEDIPYLFTAFKRVDESHTKHIEGTGLGLSIVKQFLDLMGGKVTVNSVYTKGSTFIVEIPQKIASTEEIGEYDYSKKHKLSKKGKYTQKFEAPEARLLVVDDNDANILVVTKLLRETKIQIDTAKNGKEALEKTLDNSYNLIFMDHLMPEMDGIECFRAIRSQIGGKNRDTNIVILTANAGEENRKLYATEGFNGYLVKPISGDELENEIYRQLPKELIQLTGTEGIVSEDKVAWLNANRKRRIAITTESTADLPAKVIARYDITVFAARIKTKDGVFREGKEIDTNGLLRYMENRENIATPLLPAAGDYESFYAEQLKTANNVIHISISGAIENGAYGLAKEGASSFDNVTVIDSRHISSGQGLVAIFAGRMAEAGMGVAEIKHRLGYLSKRIRSSFMIGNMDYLARSGLTSQTYANLTKLLTLRPLIVMKDGKFKSKGMIIGSDKRAWRKYISLALSGKKVAKAAIFITHVGLSKKELEYIRSEIEKNQKFDAYYFQQTSPVVAINFGPGSFGISVVEEK
ncbi:MAG: DegV family EDD domain-containing protein, partial [Lachnospiraceae bacterium]|nr:DegV family EDD domain-containing protein [Lachnospiraceae bacterium]